MSEFRIDPISGEYTLIASERAERPHDFNVFSKNERCPFCVGNEDLTPNTVIEYKDCDTDKSWSVRIIPNKYPFISEKKESDSDSNFYSKIDGYGVHDVVIDTPNHSQTIVSYSKFHMQKVFFALQNRQKDIEKDKNIKYVHIFKNQGEFAGASKNHSHWQIAGLPLITESQLKMLNGNKKYIEQKGVCGYCDIIRHEIAHRKRLICENEHFIAIAPYASKFAYEIWILPKNHCGSLLDFDSESIISISEIFQRVIKSLSKIFENINFNICFEGSPNIDEYRNIHHWYLQIIPRVTGIAGFELGTSCFIDIFSPETAAQNLKKNIVEED